jgi:hypothetical protein
MTKEVPLLLNSDVLKRGIADALRPAIGRIAGQGERLKFLGNGTKIT